jgi:hypothetical protein
VTTAEKPITGKNKNEKHNKMQLKQRGDMRKEINYFD